MNIVRDRYLNELKVRMNNGLVKIITGIRRCGKSYLLKVLFYNYLLSVGVDDSHIIKVDLDELDNEDLHDPHKLNTYIRERIIDGEMYYVFLDEIQEVQDFVPLLNGLMKIRNVDIYITGSNSRFLSTDIVTEFRGRGDQIHVYPLTFDEFYSVRTVGFDEALDEYLTYGGMPFILNRPTEELKHAYLSNLYKEIYIKDIKERYSIRNETSINELIDVISSSIGSLTNPTKLENTFKSIKNESISKNTIDSYLRILSDSFLVYEASRFDIKGKKYIGSPKKYYFSDLGLRNTRLNFRQVEAPHLMENMIYNELLARGYAVDVGVVTVNEKIESGNYSRKQLEVDFVVNKASKRYYIQSAFAIPTDEKREQELRPLNNIPDSFKKIVIVRDNIKPKRDDNGIVTISLKDFLLIDDPLEL